MKKVVRIISIFLTVLISVLLLFGYNQNKDLIESKEIEKNDPYKQVTIGSKDDYYQLTIPREFRPNIQKDSNAIYMYDVASNEMRDLGEELKNKEIKKSSKIEISTILITKSTGEKTHLNKNNSRMNNILEYNFLTKPTEEFSKKLVKKYPSIKVYANKKTKEDKYYTFSDKNGFLVIAAVNSNINGFPIARIFASYKEKFEIYFWLPELFFYNMPDVTNSIIDLISSFEPTHYKNSSLITASDNSKK
jgi:hypothetical protein